MASVKVCVPSLVLNLGQVTCKLLKSMSFVPVGSGQFRS